MADLTPIEARLADAIVSAIDMAGRVLAASPGSHYQVEKARGLADATDRLRTIVARAHEQGVRPAVVDATVARAAQGYALGRALYPLADGATAIEVAEEASSVNDRDVSRGDVSHARDLPALHAVATDRGVRRA